MAGGVACPIIKTVVGEEKTPNARGQRMLAAPSAFGHPFETLYCSGLQGR
jgi:hypothetical protein